MTRPLKGEAMEVDIRNAAAAGGIVDGADATFGAKADAAAAGDTTTATYMALFKRLLQRVTTLLAVFPTTIDTNSGAKSASTLRVVHATDDTMIGSLTETAPATDTASSGMNGRLQRIAQRLTSIIAVLPAALGGTTAANSFPVTLSTDGPFVTQTGSITETAPASDTASSGLNGRLQRIAQNITTLISSVLKVVGNVAVGAAASGSPVLIGIKDTAGNVEYLFGDTTGRAIVVGAAAAGAAISGNPVLIAGSDGTNARALAVSSTGKLAVTTSVAFNDAASATFNNPDDGSGNARLMGIGNFLFDGTAWTRQRGMQASTVLASAARTATVSTDVTNYNGRSFAIILNITAAPNTASTLTIQIRAKDSISGNYVTILVSVAIVGSASQSPPYTNRYVVALGETVAANVSASDALARTMNVNAVHSNSDSWTYSISLDMGV